MTKLNRYINEGSRYRYYREQQVRMSRSLHMKLKDVELCFFRGLYEKKEYNLFAKLLCIEHVTYVHSLQVTITTPEGGL